MIWQFGKKLGDWAFRPPDLDRKITIECGSVRSGKTWSFQPKMLYASAPECKVGGRRILFGVSKDTMYRDVLQDLIGVIGIQNFQMNKTTGSFSICGCPWQMVGAKDVGSEKYLRGATIGFAFGHELTVLPQSFFQMLLSRLSPPGARLYGTTNADNPFHWLKTEVIDNQQMIQAGDVEYINTRLEDNPTLSAEFVESTKRMFHGLFYKRFIEGLWVMATGSIYADVWSEDLLYDDASRPVGLYAQGGHIGHFVGVDYGTTNPCVFLEAIDDGKTVWIDREYYWDSTEEQRQKTDKEYGDDLEKFIHASGITDRCWPMILIDPSAASFKVELETRGLWIGEVENEVREGISRVSSALGQKKLRVHRRCRNFVREHLAYAWDDKKAMRGVEEPIKAHDHTCDADRYICAQVFDQWRLAAA